MTRMPMKTGLILWLLMAAGGCDSGDPPGVSADATSSAAVPGTSRLAGLLGGDDDQEFPRVYEPREFSFPADHGPHFDYRNEWWYLTGNLDSDAGRRFGFELTLFRFSLSPEAPLAGSAWRTNQVFIGHFAITDVAGERFLVAERYARGAAGLAGAEAAPLRVWLEDWFLESRGMPGEQLSPWRLEASTERAALALDLVALKPPVRNGERGLSQKSAEPGNASYYYSMPRLSARGELVVDDETYDVTGLAWLDREWSSSALSEDQVGWDWFALQLGDQTELMFYQLRNSDGSVSRYSSGTFIRADGSSMALDADDVALTVNEGWTNSLGDRYPASWTMEIPSIGMELDILPVLDDQELDTTVRYWEGAVDVQGERGGNPLDGRGYVELTGYSP